MRHTLNRWLFAAAFAAAVVALGWLFVDASSPLALGAEIVEGGPRQLPIRTPLTARVGQFSTGVSEGRHR